MKKLRCNACGRRVVNQPAEKMAHVMQYHPHVPLIRIATTLFSSERTFENIGKRMGDAFKRMVS